MAGKKRKFIYLFSYPILGLVYLLSILPMPVLYGISSIIYLLLYRTFAYRVKVVRNNLRNSFPEKSDAELRLIEKRFYKHLSDIFVETIKSFTISPAQLKKRMKVLNADLLEKYYHKNQKVIAVTGHIGNWEWAAITLPFQSSHDAQGVYLPIKDPVFNRAMIRSRSRFGIDLLLASDMRNEMEKRKDVLSITGFIADQSPSNPDKGEWVTFLNQDTCVAKGTERYARIYDAAVLFGMIKKVKRGYYTLEYRLISDQAAVSAEGEITARHTAVLEELIKAQPEYWLWSHKRWKHKRKAG
ncbi:MAG: lysophospholipid acyltransferase family protein [Bacteroidia bacterium]